MTMFLKKCISTMLLFVFLSGCNDSDLEWSWDDANKLSTTEIIFQHYCDSTILKIEGDDKWWIKDIEVLQNDIDWWIKGDDRKGEVEYVDYNRYDTSRLDTVKMCFKSSYLELRKIDHNNLFVKIDNVDKNADYVATFTLRSKLFSYYIKVSHK